MKTGTLGTRIALLAILLTVLAYFGVNIAAYFSDPYSTTPAYTYAADNAVTVSGYVVREEEVLPGSGSFVYSGRGEGERVSPGGTVAQIYQSARDLENANALRSLEEQLTELKKAQTFAGGDQSYAALSLQIDKAMLSLQTALARNDLTAAIGAGGELRSASLRYGYAYGDAGNPAAAIASLEGRLSALSDTVGSGTTYVTAPRGGLFSSLVDGYETVLTPQRLETMTARDYRAIAPEPASGVGRMIYGDTWYFATLMRTESMGHLAVGDTVQIKFQTGLSQKLSLRVRRIGDEDSGQRLVVFSSSQYLHLTTLLRRQNAQIIFDSYEGIRVPRSAVRIAWEPVTDGEGQPVLESDGTAKKIQRTGVYCVWGNRARFKPVEIVWQEDQYMLVAPTEGTGDAYRIRAGDQVITAAAELYDGKVIEE